MTGVGQGERGGGVPPTAARALKVQPVHVPVLQGNQNYYRSSACACCQWHCDVIERPSAARTVDQSGFDYLGSRDVLCP